MQPARLDARVLCFRRILLGVLVVFLLGALAGTPACRAQTLETPQHTNERIQSLSLDVQKVVREYVIGAGDMLAISVFDVEELSRDIRVSQTGTIALPLVPVRLHVAGLTEIQTEQKIAEVLEANGLITHPQVSVTVKERKSKPITVIGAVNHPMVYQADHTVTLLEVLSEAGGISNDAANIVIITRVGTDALPNAPFADPDGSNHPAPTPSTPIGSGTVPRPSASLGNNFPSAEEASQKSATSVPAEYPGPASGNAAGALPPIQFTVKLDELLEAADPKNNPVLQAGDVVTIPRAGTVYAVGAVQRPGGFVLSSDHSNMTALKILSLSGGLTKTAKSEHAVIIRKDSGGQQTQVALNLKKIMKQQSEDIILQPSDILVVPESGRRQAALRLAEVALAVGTAVAIYRVGTR